MGGGRRGRTWEEMVAVFWSCVSKGPNVEDCWVWTGTTNPHGYGRMGYGGTYLSAHRLSWWIEYGFRPTQQVLHKCDNPPCVRPAHLFAGTHLLNMQDMVSKDRPSHPHGILNGRAKLGRAQIFTIRASTETQCVLARRFGVTQTQISRIKNRKAWSHVV